MEEGVQAPRMRIPQKGLSSRHNIIEQKTPCHLIQLFNIKEETLGYAFYHPSPPPPPPKKEVLSRIFHPKRHHKISNPKTSLDRGLPPGQPILILLLPPSVDITLLCSIRDLLLWEASCRALSQNVFPWAEAFA